MELLMLVTMITRVLSSAVVTDDRKLVCHIINLPAGGRVRIETYFKCDREDDAPSHDRPQYIQCPLHSYRFPRSNQMADMIRVKTPIPEIENGTLCTWVTVNNDETFEGTLMSYSVGVLANSFAVFTEAIDRGQVRVFVSRMGRLIKAPMKNNPSHLCVSFSTKVGLGNVYVDGKLIQNGVEFNKTTSLQGGGIIIVGQEQDAMGRAFDRQQAFKGTITNYMFWKRELTLNEIEDIAQRCTCPNDYLFNLDPEDVILHGNVVAIDIRNCPTRLPMREV